MKKLLILKEMIQHAWACPKQAHLPMKQSCTQGTHKIFSAVDVGSRQESRSAVKAN